MAEEWVKDAKNEARLADNLHAKINKVLSIAKQKNKELGMKLVVEEWGRKSAKAGLKNTQDQVEKQCKKLHHAEIELAMAKQEAVDLKAELEKAKEVAWAAKATADASEQKFYDLEVQKTEACLTEELAKVCRDYCQKVLTKALNLVGVPATSEWRRVENVYYLPNLREAPAALLGLEAYAASAITAPEQLPSTQAFLRPLETSKGPGNASDQCQGVEVAKGKEAKALPEAKGLEANRGKEVAPKTKGSELVKPQAVAQEKKASSSKAADPPISQLASKEDPPPAKA